MTFKQLEIFLSVIENKSFSRAADFLYLSQPSVSIAITSLEEELQCKLIDRNSKKIRATAAGNKIYSDAKEIINMCNNLKNTAYEFSDKFNGELHGQINIAASTVPSQFILPLIVNEFSNKNPNVKISITQLDSSEVHKAVKSHKYEIGLVGYKQSSSNLSYKKLCDDELILVSNQKNLKINKEDLIKLYLNGSLIGREIGSGSMEIFNRYMSKLTNKNKKKSARITFNSTESVLRAASSGVGIAAVSKIAAKLYLDKNLLYKVDTDFALPTRSFYLIGDNKISVSKVTKSFINYLTNLFNNSTNIFQ